MPKPFQFRSIQTPILQLGCYVGDFKNVAPPGPGSEEPENIDCGVTSIEITAYYGTFSRFCLDGRRKFSLKKLFQTKNF